MEKQDVKKQDVKKRGSRKPTGETPVTREVVTIVTKKPRLSRKKGEPLPSHVSKSEEALPKEEVTEKPPGPKKLRVSRKKNGVEKEVVTNPLPSELTSESSNFNVTSDASDPGSQTSDASDPGLSGVTPLFIEEAFVDRDREANYELASQILGIPRSANWTIIENIKANINPRFLLIHFTTPSADATGLTTFPKYPQFKGLILDTVGKTIVTRSFPHTPVVELNRLSDRTTGSEDEEILTLPVNGKTYQYKVKDLKIKKACEGTILRFALVSGQVRFTYLDNGGDEVEALSKPSPFGPKILASTHKHTNPERSFWGDSDRFTDIYIKGGGPSMDDLFDLTCDYSPFCYIFMLSDPTIQLGSSLHILSPHVIFLGCTTVYPVDQCPYLALHPEAKVEKVRKFWPVIKDLPKKVDTPGLYHLPNMTVKEADEHLATGFDGTPEPIILYTETETGEVENVVKVHPTTYQKRLALISDNANIPHAYFMLISDPIIQTILSNKSTPTEYQQALAEFNRRYKIYPVDFDVTSRLRQQYELTSDIRLTEVLPDLVPPIDRLEDLLVREKKFNQDMIHYQIWLNYLDALPKGKKGQAIGIYDQYQADKELLIEWLETLIDNRKVVVAERRDQRPRTGHQTGLMASSPADDRIFVCKRTKQVVDTALKEAHAAIISGKNVNRYGKSQSLKVLVHNKIKGVVNNEIGYSFYKMNRDRKQAGWTGNM